jgi:Spy/CpxP family protein refolding chaperone
MLDRRLGLSDAQRAQIDAILDERHRQSMIVFETIKPKMDSIRLNAREQMRQLLTEEQRAKYEALLKELSDSTKRKDQ